MKCKFAMVVFDWVNQKGKSYPKALVELKNPRSTLVKTDVRIQVDIKKILWCSDEQIMRAVKQLSREGSVWAGDDWMTITYQSSFPVLEIHPVSLKGMKEMEPLILAELL